MKILMMADVPPNPDSGAAGTEWQTARALRELGHEVTTIWADDLGRRIRHGNLHYLLELPRECERVALERLRHEAFDVVHVNQPHGFRAARTIHRSHPETIFVHRSHGFEPYVEETVRGWREQYPENRPRAIRHLASATMASLLRRHATAIAQEADGHIVSSSLDADFMAHRLDVPRERIAVIPQAAPADFLMTDPAAMTADRFQRILYVSQFAFVKAPMITASAIRGLASADPELEFTWVCDRRNHAEVRVLLGTAAARTSLIGWMPQEDLVRIYDEHGIFLFPSFYEGFGKVFLEAMSRGLCVIASDMGGPHDLIRSGTDGILVPTGDANAIVEALRSLTLLQASRISTAARSRASEYTWTRLATEVTRFYEDLRQSR
jgi:glycosyltransferase involved in cell wall biosynthesis